MRICAYAVPLSHAAATLAGSQELTGSVARTFVRLVDTSTPGSGCGSPVVMLLRYRHRLLSAKAAGCEPELLRGPYGVSTTNAAALGVYSQPISGPGLRVPSIVGVPLSVAVARLAGFYAHHPKDEGEFQGSSRGKEVPVVLQVSEQAGRGAPFGTVIFQTPLPSLPNEPLDGIDALVATPAEPRCRAGELVGVWSGDGFGTGDTFGGITFGDRSSTPCSLTGRLSVQGMGAAGQADTPKLSWRLPSPFELSPHADLRLTSLRSESTLIGFIGLAGDSRDGRGPSGLCQHETVPANWEIRVDGLVLTLANGPDRHLQGRDYLSIMYARSEEDEPFFSCLGNLIPTLGTAPRIDN